eukprot:352930-Chlamydomonas_euryale.AAC.2
MHKIRPVNAPGLRGLAGLCATVGGVLPDYQTSAAYNCAELRSLYVCGAYSVLNRRSAPCTLFAALKRV